MKEIGVNWNKLKKMAEQPKCNTGTGPTFFFDFPKVQILIIYFL